MLENEGLKRNMKSVGGSCEGAIDVESACMKLAGFENKEEIKERLKEGVSAALLPEEQRLSEEGDYYVDFEVSFVDLDVRVTGDYTCPEGRGTLECSFEYSADCTVKVTVEDTYGRRYPVFTGEYVEERYPELVFLVSGHYETA